jgi:hypothetical protein
MANLLSFSDLDHNTQHSTADDGPTVLSGWDRRRPLRSELSTDAGSRGPKTVRESRMSPRECAAVRRGTEGIRNRRATASGPRRAGCSLEGVVRCHEMAGRRQGWKRGRSYSRVSIEECPRAGRPDIQWRGVVGHGPSRSPAGSPSSLRVDSGASVRHEKPRRPPHTRPRPDRRTHHAVVSSRTRRHRCGTPRHAAWYVASSGTETYDQGSRNKGISGSTSPTAIGST